MQVGRLFRQQVCAVSVDEDVRHHVLDRLVGADGVAELLAVLGVLVGHFQYGPGGTDDARRLQHGRLCRRPGQDRPTVADIADHGF